MRVGCASHYPDSRCRVQDLLALLLHPGPLPQGHFDRIPLRAILMPLPRGQDLLALLLHPDAAAAGHFETMTEVLRTSCFTINRDRFESKLSPIPIYVKRRSSDRLIVSVGISGFEPEQTEPKSVVLPLHHIPIPAAKIQ